MQLARSIWKKSVGLKDLSAHDAAKLKLGAQNEGLILANIADIKVL